MHHQVKTRLLIEGTVGDCDGLREIAREVISPFMAGIAAQKRRTEGEQGQQQRREGRDQAGCTHAFPPSAPEGTFQHYIPILGKWEGACPFASPDKICYTRKQRPWR